MKIYSFYITPTETLREWALATKDPYFMKDTPVLYAWTDNKDYAAEFKKQRDMKKFIFKEFSMTEEEYKNSWRLGLSYSNFTAFHLSKIQLHTASDPLVDLRVKVDILGTWYEETSVVLKGDKIWDLYPGVFVDVQILNDKYLKALETLGYMKFYKFFCKDKEKYDDRFYDPYYSSYEDPDGFVCDDFRHSYKLNEVAIFLKLFGDTFSKNAE